MAKKILSALLCVLLIASSMIIVSAADTSKATAGATDTEYSDAAAKLDEKYAYDGDDLGATYTKEATTFKVWAPTAQNIKVNLYTTGSAGEEGAESLGSTPLAKVLKTPGDESSFTGVWSATIEGDLKNKFYTYSIIASNVTGSKTSNTETEDVYSVATGVNGKRSQIIDLKDTDPEGWDKDTHVVTDKSTDGFIWEVHVKDFSYNKNSGVSDKNRGKYLAFTETGTTLNGEGKFATGIDYLKELGVTAVQINPFYDYGSVDEGGSDTQFNWGYDPVNYNVPEGSYSSNPYDGNVRIKECKQMIQALHNAGIGVIMDVVYNHTYSADSCFERTVPNYYYRMTKTGTYANGSGCGNETASERAMFRKFMRDSCLYWVNEFHVDGFRFDLMGLHDTETMNLIREDLDKVNPKLTIWGEGWTGGGCALPSKTCTGADAIQAIQAGAPQLSERVAFFNDGIRDAIKGGVFGKKNQGWVQGSKAGYKNLIYGILANTQNGNWHSKAPSQTVTYASCHDNQTLWDRLADSQNLTDYWRKRHPDLVAQNKLTGGLLNVAQGITFVLAGEEMGRSKDNDENSYSSSADLNMIDWSLVQKNADIVSYYKGMRQIRTHFSPFTDDTNKASANYLIYSGTKEDTTTYAGVWTNDKEGEWKKLAVVANGSANDLVDYQLNEVGGVSDWVVIANNEEAGLRSLGTVTDGKFTVPGRSMVVAVDKASFDSVAVPSDTGSVKVQAHNRVTDEVIDSYTVTGKIGSVYSLSIPDLGEKYELAETKGELEGKFAEGVQNIELYFDYFAPESVKQDFNGDGKMNINDATYIQKAIGKAITLTAEQEKKADVTQDGVLDVNDVTMYQKYIASVSVATGTVTVNYYKTGTTESIAKSVVTTVRVGESVDVAPAQALGYKLNADASSKETKVKAVYGNVDVNYYYDATTPFVTLHVKHSGSGTWNPTFWLWGSKNGADSGSNYCTNKSWPGDTVNGHDPDGWYTTSFTANGSDDSYNVIVSNGGTTQSPDCKGFIQSELWIIIDDNVKDAVSLAFYDVNPVSNPTAEPIYVS